MKSILKLFLVWHLLQLDFKICEEVETRLEVDLPPRITRLYPCFPFSFVHLKHGRILIGFVGIG